jgi:hypothetical protein
MDPMGELEPARHKSADLSCNELPSRFFDASGEVKAFVLAID